MKLQDLNKVIEFAHSDSGIVGKALASFFGFDEPSFEKEECAFDLFSEWLVFDYKTGNDAPNLFSKYVLLNPDGLESKRLDILGQVSGTQYFGAFKILSVKRKVSIKLENVENEKVYDIFDETSTPTIPERGLLVGRIARVDDKWLFVGANPLYFPIDLSDNTARLFKSSSAIFSSPKEVWEFLSRTGGKTIEGDKLIK